MLVLTRGREESIVLGDDVVITVVDIRGDKVRLGIDAPREMVILRKEVYDAVRQENLDAAGVDPEGLGGLDDLLDNS